MKFGIFTMPEHFPWESWSLAFDRDVQEIVDAEFLGFDEFWIGEHHSGGYEPVPVPEYIIAKASALTGRIMLGTGTVNVPYHDPFLIAERLAFLDNLCHGRLLFGLGGGGLPTDWELFGFEAEEMRPRLDHGLDIVERLILADGPISYETPYHRGTDRQIQVRPYKNRKPEFAIAGLTGLGSYRCAGTRGWGALSVYFSPVKYSNNDAFPDVIKHGKILDEAARAADRDPVQARRQWRIVREVYVSDSREKALEEIRAGVGKSYSYLIELGLGALMKLDETADDSELTLEWMVDNIPWIIGSPDECIQQIRDLYDTVGGFGTFVVNSRDWVTSDLQRRSWELFARNVIPALEGLDVGSEAPAWETSTPAPA
jgi:limonene 1,2-monooxygenase